VTLADKVRNRTARVLQHRWRTRPYQSTQRHIIVGGCPRSGTTLFRRILDRHPGICCGPEMNVMIPARFQLGPLTARSGIPADELRSMLRGSRSQGEFVDRFAERYRSMHGKPRWAEKTPLNVRHFGWILERFPQARLIHLIRDGRDVVCSLAEHPDWRWVDGGWVKELHPRPVETYARTWVRDTGAGMRHRGDARYLEVRYEDLVAHPEQTLRDVFRFIEEPFVEAVLEPEDVAAPDRGDIFGSSVGRWRRDLTPDQLQRFMRVAEDRLAELDYDE
jgi:hypothetical protein